MMIKCRLSNREVSFISILCAAGAAAAAALCVVMTTFSLTFCYVDIVCGFTTEYVDLID